MTTSGCRTINLARSSADRAVEVFRLGERGYELASFAAETGPVRSTVLDGFEVDLDSVF